MRRIAIGQYVRGTSPVHRMDPRVKLVACLAYMVSAFVAPAPWGLVPVLAMLALAIAASRVPSRLIARASGPLAFFVLLTVITNLLVVHEGTPVASLGWLVVTDVGVASAVVLGVRVLALMLAGALVTLTTTPVGITDGTERLLSPLARLGVPVGELATMVSIAIRFIPTLSEEMRHVMTAQAARGAAVDEGSLARRARVVVSLIVPLFASALRHAEGLGDAMEARCYVGGEGRTHYHVLALRRVDAAGIAVVAAYLAVVVAMAVAR